MNHRDKRRGSPTWLLVVLLVVAFPLCVGAAPPVNEKCPVMPDEKAVPEFSVEHQGRTVHFCCEGCVRKFQANPTPHLANLPPAPPPPAKPPDPQPSVWDRFLDAFLVVSEFCERHLSVILGVVVVALLVAVAGRLHARLTRQNSPSRWVRVLAPFTNRAAFLIVLLAGVCGIFWQEKELAREELARFQTHNAQQQAAAGKTQLGASAKLLQWAWPQSLHELPKGIRNTYYRGNDERSEKLFNGGNYRTATFHVALKATDGSDVQPGAKVSGQKLAVRFDIERAPNTAPNFFKADEMKRVFLASLDDRSKDEVSLLTVSQADRSWTATTTVGDVSEKGYQRLAGVWGVCVGDPKGGIGGSMIHYYIQAVLHIQDGVLLPESTVWMVPVYPSPILHGPQADGHWFSDRPIPEIPDGKNVTDPKLLGLPSGKP